MAGDDLYVSGGRGHQGLGRARTEASPAPDQEAAPRCWQVPAGAGACPHPPSCPQKSLSDRGPFGSSSHLLSTYYARHTFPLASSGPPNHLQWDHCQPSLQMTKPQLTELSDSRSRTHREEQRQELSPDPGPRVPKAAPHSWSHCPSSPHGTLLPRGHGCFRCTASSQPEHLAFQKCPCMFRRAPSTSTQTSQGSSIKPTLQVRHVGSQRPQTCFPAPTRRGMKGHMSGDTCRGCQGRTLGAQHAWKLRDLPHVGPHMSPSGHDGSQPAGKTWGGEGREAYARRVPPAQPQTTSLTAGQGGTSNGPLCTR